MFWEETSEQEKTAREILRMTESYAANPKPKLDVKESTVLANRIRILRFRNSGLALYFVFQCVIVQFT